MYHRVLSRLRSINRGQAQDSTSLYNDLQYIAILIFFGSPEYAITIWMPGNQHNRRPTSAGGRMITCLGPGKEVIKVIARCVWALDNPTLDDGKMGYFEIVSLSKRAMLNHFEVNVSCSDSPRSLYLRFSMCQNPNAQIRTEKRMTLSWSLMLRSLMGFKLKNIKKPIAKKEGKKVTNNMSWKKRENTSRTFALGSIGVEWIWINEPHSRPSRASRVATFGGKRIWRQRDYAAPSKTLVSAKRAVCMT